MPIRIASDRTPNPSGTIRDGGGGPLAVERMVQLHSPEGFGLPGSELNRLGAIELPKTCSLHGRPSTRTTIINAPMDDFYWRMGRPESGRLENKRRQLLQPAYPATSVRGLLLGCETGLNSNSMVAESPAASAVRPTGW
jgi:hypothetical protein